MRRDARGVRRVPGGLTAPFVHRLRIRYHECDAQGIVFNAHHFAYFDIALTELWREAFGSYDAVREMGSDVVVARAEADFHHSPRFDDEIELRFAIDKLGNSSMVSRVEEHRDGDLLVTGRMVHVFVDAETMEKQPIPDGIRERLSAYVG